MRFSSLVIGNDLAVVRPADFGVSDAERGVGVKILHYDFGSSSYQLKEKLLDMGYAVLSQEEWNEFIAEQTGSNENITDKFKPSGYVPLDKWEHERPIW